MSLVPALWMCPACRQWKRVLDVGEKAAHLRVIGVDQVHRHRGCPKGRT